jgi:hypothetical protein
MMRRFWVKRQFEVGEELSYLGMKINIKDEGTTVDMSFYVAQILEGKDVQVAASPTTKETYNVDEGLQKLCDAEKKWFHSTTAKLLYLAKRARPDILTAVIFLCTRVQGATCEDKRKLIRVLGYLKGTTSRTLLLRAHRE